MVLIVTRSKHDGIQVRDVAGTTLRTFEGGRLYSTLGGTLAVVCGADCFSLYEVEAAGIKPVVEKASMGGPQIIECKLLSPKLLLLTAKLDTNTFQYRLYDVAAKAFVGENSLPLLPMVIFKDGDYAYAASKGDVGVFVCRAGRTGLIQAVLKGPTVTSTSVMGGTEVGNFRLLPDASTLLLHVKGKSGNPAKCQAIQLNLDQVKGVQPKEHSLLAERAFFKLDSVDFVPSDSAVGCLLWCHSDNDTSGANYYGESQLFLFHAPTRSFQLVPLDKNGPVHDVKWRPQSPEFVVAYGFMPSRVARFTVGLKDGALDILQTLATECSINTVLFQEPAGEFFILGGFGNLPGKFELWSSKTGRRVRSAQEAPGASRLQWLGSWLLAATVSPRLRVDNCVKTWDVGTIEGPTKTPFQELYQASIVGEASEFAHPFSIMPTNNAATSSAPTSAGGKYVPPSLRNKQAAESSALSPSSVSELKRALDNALPHIDNRPKPSKEEQRLKRLQERLDQIADLKDKQRQGTALELNQVEKIASEAAVRKEISDLKKALASK